MLSRRSVRVKVMQILYAQSRDKDLQDKEVIELYHDSIKGTFELFIYNLYLITAIAKVSVEDEAKRISKYLPTEDDKMFKSTLYHNEIIKGLVNNTHLSSRFKQLGFDKNVDEDIIRKLYKAFSQEKSYIDYWHNRKNVEDDRDILLELYRFLRSNDIFNEMVDDMFYQWGSEKSVVIGAVKKVLKRNDFKNDFVTEYYPPKETTHDFGLALMKYAMNINDELDKYVIPKLIKWDKDRIAAIDMILLKMALAEILYFNTIPCNVTLNEYIELSKTFSTDKSKEFINGVMDKVIKDLKEKGIINKTNIQ